MSLFVLLSHVGFYVTYMYVFLLYIAKFGTRHVSQVIDMIVNGFFRGKKWYFVVKNGILLHKLDECKINIISMCKPCMSAYSLLLKTLI